METRALAGMLLFASITLAGCPLARPREVDCGAARSYAESADKALAPFAALDVKTATDDQIKGWAAALATARAAVPLADTMVHDDVKDASTQYRKALLALEAAVGDRSKAKSAAADEKVATAQAELSQKRKQITAKCPAP